jgi:hypothetical protein
VLVDFAPLLYIAGPLRIDWRRDGRRAGINRSLLLAGGLVASAPRGNHDLRRRMIVMVAGGPLASLIAGAQFLTLWHVTSAATASAAAPFVAQLVGIALLALGLSSLLIGMITLFPTRSGGFYSDGARLLRLLRGGSDVEREVALMSITGLAVGGVRPRDWDPSLMQLCAAIEDDGPFEVGGRYYAFAHAFDAGEIDVARAHAAFVCEHIDQLPKGARASLLFGVATFHALVDNDADRARTLIRSAPQSLLPASHQRALAQAAISLADGDGMTATDLAHEAIQLSALAFDRGTALLDVSLAERIIERAAPRRDVSA